GAGDGRDEQRHHERDERHPHRVHPERAERLHRRRHRAERRAPRRAHEHAEQEPEHEREHGARGWGELGHRGARAGV
ncbi:MAG: hypothetical protein AVDCRST_MAG40-2949, partial [uncultured Gemmatimonadaceae bacterium]